MDKSLLEYADELGPEKMISLYDPKHNLKAIVAIDNTAAGPSIGGIRMAPDVDSEEAYRLARAMTLKNAAAGLPHGGGKSVIQADPAQLTMIEKEQLIRSFARAIANIKGYIPGPDMGTDEVCMAWIKDEIGRSVGLPREIGGIPLDEIGATAIGLVAAAEVSCSLYDIELTGATVAIQGFGAVGKFAALFLEEKGAIIVAASDSRGTISNKDGLKAQHLMEQKDNGLSVADYAGGEKEDVDAIVKIPCDIWIPAARPDVIHMGNVNDLNTKLILQGANIPITLEAEHELFKKGIHVIPDFIANAGGVICASVEYHGGSEEDAKEMIRQKVSYNTREVILNSKNKKITPRQAAEDMAKSRVLTAMSFRK